MESIATIDDLIAYLMSMGTDPEDHSISSGIDLIAAGMAPNKIRRAVVRRLGTRKQV